MLSDYLLNEFNHVSRQKEGIIDGLYRISHEGLSALSMQIFTAIKSNLAPYKVLRFRKRYFVTKSNKVRIRYVLPVFLMFSGSALSTLAFLENKSPAFTPEQHYQNIQISEQQLTEKKQAELQRALPNNIIDLVRMTPQTEAVKRDRTRKLEIQPGETVAGILQSQGIDGNDAYKTVEALSEYIDPRKIKAGQTFKFRTKPSKDDDENLVLAELTMDIDSIKSVKVSRDGDEYVAEVNEKEVMQRTYAGATQIQTSLYGSAARSGIPSAVIANMIRMYSWSVDFQRDIRRDDQIELLYDVYETEEGKAVKYGDILFANLTLSDISLKLYRYEKSDGTVDYYDAKGRSIKKTLMKTPVDGARISSGFGMRKHPVLGYNKMHKGMDFAASLGTPIYAAGDGVLEKVGRNGGYGNYIRIRHTGSLKTAYAHMHKFAKGISTGQRVKQGQLIGYVGSTGRSTGPHLHYEVILDGKQVNPNRVDLPVGESLTGKELERFKEYIRKYDQMYVELSRGQKFAALPLSDEDDKKKKS